MQYEPNKIYVCLTHRHPGHFYAAQHGAVIRWRFYDRYKRQWFKEAPEQSCTLTLFDDPRHSA